MTSLQGPGERNFNAVSHKPKLTGTDWIELNWCVRWFMGYGIKISFPRSRNDVTDHLVETKTYQSMYLTMISGLFVERFRGRDDIHG